MLVRTKIVGGPKNHLAQLTNVSPHKQMGPDGEVSSHVIVSIHIIYVTIHDDVAIHGYFSSQKMGLGWALGSGDGLRLSQILLICYGFQKTVMEVNS